MDEQLRLDLAALSDAQLRDAEITLRAAVARAPLAPQRDATRDYLDLLGVMIETEIRDAERAATMGAERL